MPCHTQDTPNVLEQDITTLANVPQPGAVVSREQLSSPWGHSFLGSASSGNRPTERPGRTWPAEEPPGFQVCSNVWFTAISCIVISIAWVSLPFHHFMHCCSYCMDFAAIPCFVVARNCYFIFLDTVPRDKVKAGHTHAAAYRLRPG